MSERFPGYDVLAKRAGMSWNDPTRRAVDLRLAVSRVPRFFNAREWAVLLRVCDRILPQPRGRAPIPLAALIDAKMLAFGHAGTRIDPMPWDGEAWKLALAALDSEANDVRGCGFAALDDDAADALLRCVQQGEVSGEMWHRIPPDVFFAKRLLPDIVEAYYGHPTAWSEIGFGGPASPRGYVRMDTNRRDPWEAAEVYHDPASALKKNRNVF